MSTRVLLEGPAIEPLLEQVRSEYGAAARIVSAEKVRTGGLGGFFAKQRYEVAIEVEEPTAPSVTAPAASSPSAPAAGATDELAALLELVEASQDRFRNLPPRTAWTRRS
ncbi:hypothetical protein ACFQX7_06510 [Luedemannella flava]